MCVLAGAALALLFALPAAAETLPGAELRLERTAAAQDCPDEHDLARELRSRTQGVPQSEEARLGIDVALDAEGGAFVARVTVSGRKQGKRTLRAEGPTCGDLRDALIVLCLLLLDAEANAPHRAPPPPPPRGQPPRVNDRRAAPELLVGAFAAATHGLPLGFSLALGGEVGVRLQRWEVSGGGFWAPDREVSFAPGTVTLRLAAGKLDGCYALFLEPRWFRLNGCAHMAVGALRAEPAGYSRDRPRSRPLWLAGGGLEPRILVLPALSLGATLAVLAPLHREEFSIEGLPGHAYATDSVVAWLGLEITWKIW
jgi:hypothetical protein